jgi:hypothetical protein
VAKQRINVRGTQLSIAFLEDEQTTTSFGGTKPDVVTTLGISLVPVRNHKRSFLIYLRVNKPCTIVGLESPGQLSTLSKRN